MNRIVSVFTVGLLCAGCSFVSAGGGTAAQKAADEGTAESRVSASPQTTANATEETLQELGITITRRRHQSDDYEFRGEDGAETVEVLLTAEGSHTRITVTVVKNKVEYNRNRADEILGGITRRAR